VKDRLSPVNHPLH